MSKAKKIIDVFTQKYIRNISIISHVDHGKTTLSDYLLASGGLLPENLAGSLRALDNLPEEQRRGITIDTSLASYSIDFKNNQYLINLIDTPGHVDFSGKVAESLRLVDGSIIIVDAVEGIMAQTKSVLKQAIKEKIVFLLFINKIDRLINELELNANQIQLRLQKIIGDIQHLSILKGMSKKNIPNFSKGSIILGSALDGWAIDIDYVNLGRNINDIINFYKENDCHSFPSETKLSNVFNKAIINIFPTPKIGQDNKFPALIKNELSNSMGELLTSCDDKKNIIILVGRQERTTKIRKNSFIIRVLSGTISKGLVLKSSITNNKIKIISISLFHGRSRINFPKLKAGYIGSVSFSDHLDSGDILIPNSEEIVILNDISYIQDAVVAVSIEPLKINQIGKLQKVVEEITEYTPGLNFELNKTTGELLVMGVGTLQLDVFVNDLKAMDYEIEVSSPVVISYEIPLNEVEDCLKDTNIAFVAGRSEKILKSYDYKLVYSDNDNNNYLLLRHQAGRDGLEGLIEVFKQSMSISPNTGKRVKGFCLVILNDEYNTIFDNYEKSMIFGSRIIRNALSLSNSILHEPFYDIEITLPEEYIGNVLHELQRLDAEIFDVISQKMDSVILGRISVKEAIFMADKFRQVSDGNAFWSYPSINFLPIKLDY